MKLLQTYLSDYDVGALAGMVGGGVSYACTGWTGILITILFYLGYLLVARTLRNS